MISAWLAKKGAQLWAWLAAIGAAALVIFGFYQNAKRKGELNAKQEHAEAEVKRIDGEAVRKVEQAQAQAAIEVESIKVAKDETDKVNRLDNGDAANKLRNEWSRD